MNVSTQPGSSIAQAAISPPIVGGHSKLWQSLSPSTLQVPPSCQQVGLDTIWNAGNQIVHTIRKRHGCVAKPQFSGLGHGVRRGLSLLSRFREETPKRTGAENLSQHDVLLCCIIF